MPQIFDYTGFEEIPKEFIEKKKVRRSANACGIGLIALFGVMNFWPLLYFKIFSFFGINPTQAVNISSEPFFSQLLSIAISFLMIVLPFFIVGKAMGVKILREIPFKKLKKGMFWPLFFLGVGFCLFSSFAVSYGGQIFDAFGIEFPELDNKMPKGVLGVIISVLSISFFPAFLEEFALRGIVLGFLRRRSDTLAIIGSAFVFGFMHASAQQIVFAFLVGLILGFITVKTDSIWPAIAIHFFNNLISVVSSYLSEINSEISSLVLVIVFTFAVLAAVFAILSLSKKEDFFKLNENQEIPLAKKLRWFLTAPTIIISVILSLIIAFFVR